MESTPASTETDIPQEEAEVHRQLAGKRIALVGFPPDETGELSELFEAVQGFCCTVDGTVDGPDSTALDAFDLCIVKLPDDLTENGWIDPLRLAGKRKPLLAVGTSELLLRYIKMVQEHADDFMRAPWQPKEIIFRSYNILSKAQLQARSTTLPNDVSVLIADDDPGTSTLVRTILQRFGMKCVVAGDGTEALLLAQENRPNAAILDVNMAHLDGFEVLATLKGDVRTRNMVVIMLTARQREADIIRGFGLGAGDYMVKPFNPLELVARLQRLLSKEVN